MKKSRSMSLIEIGVLIVFIGVILIIIGSLLTAQKQDSKTKIAFGGFIGPIPFGFWNDKQLVTIVIVISGVLLILWTISNNIKW